MNYSVALKIPLYAARAALGGRPSPPRRILLTRVQNLGDCVVFLPTINRVRAAFPDARIDVLAGTNAGEAVFGMCASVDGILKTSWPAERTRDERLSEIAELQQGKYDTVLISTEETGSALKMLAAGIPWRAGFGRIEHMGESYTEKMPHLLSRVLRQPAGWHEVDVNLQLAGALGCPDMPREFKLAPPPEAQQAAEDIAKGEGLQQGRFVCVHPGTKQALKRWPAAAFARACDIVAESGVKVVFVGTGDDRPAVESIRLLMSGESVDLTGRTSVTGLAALFGRAGAFLGNDSGPMHLAAACGLPVAAVFVGSDPAIWGPYCPDSRRRVFGEDVLPAEVAAGLLEIAGAGKDAGPEAQ